MTVPINIADLINLTKLKGQKYPQITPVKSATLHFCEIFNGAGADLRRYSSSKLIAMRLGG
jgi:hypothetical protein